MKLLVSCTRRKKDELYDVYAIVDEEELSNMVTEAEQAHASSQHVLAWKLINEISGRHRAQSSKLKANSPEERVQLWFNHSSQLLRSPPKKPATKTPLFSLYLTHSGSLKTHLHLRSTSLPRSQSAAARPVMIMASHPSCSSMEALMTSC